MRAHRFFGMIIPEAYGGLGFSARAQSEVVRKLAVASPTAGITVMVPNSLGPGELLLQYGTEAQKSWWLPRLADGREIPCFALTSEEAGSDAAAMTDEGVVAHGTYRGRPTLGIRLTFAKRYITLAPVATVVGLAFKLRDPDGLLGDAPDLGITVALVPTDLPGVDVGRRHLACLQAFQNGPIAGREVFVPLDAVIGGRDGIGHGWPMLMSALAAGRGVSLPSLAAAATTYAAHTTGAYARVRAQFARPIGRFEGVRARLARLAGTAYGLDAARRLTCAGIDAGHAPAVVSAMMKVHATYRMRTAVDDAMDVHGGKTIIDGPRNYLGNLHRALPLGVTVEGANIVTRHLIIFGQGAVRCHPHLLDEMLALEAEDRDAGLARFDAAFWRHVGHAMGSLGRAWWGSMTGARFAAAPSDAGSSARHYRRLSHYAACLAASAELVLSTLGGGLKRKELISARLGDVLSELYLLSAVLERFEADGRPAADEPLRDWCLATGYATIEQRFEELFDNLPSRGAAGLGRLVVQPFGRRRRAPSDALAERCARLLLEPSPTRARLTAGVDGVAEAAAPLEDAFARTTATADLAERMRRAGAASIAVATARGVLSEAEGDRLAARDRAVREAVAVDDFAAEDLIPASPPHPTPRQPARSDAR
jgi:acyl-CoA dehydrogenase